MPDNECRGDKYRQEDEDFAYDWAVSSSMACMAACLGVAPSLSRMRLQFSTTTMASSTTMAIASTRPNRVRVLIVNPMSFMTAKVAMVIRVL